MLNEVKKRPLSMSEIFMQGIIVFKENFKSYFDICIYTGIPVSLVIVFISISKLGVEATKGLSALITAMNQSGVDVSKIPFTDEQQNTIAIYYLLMMLVQFIFVPIITMAAARFTLSRINNEPYTGREASIASVSKGGVLIGAGMLKLTLVIAGMGLFLVPAILAFVYFYFVVYAIVLEDKGIISSFKYSVSLIKGNFIKMTVLLFCFYIMNYSLRGTLSLLTSALPYNAFTLLFGNLFGILIDIMFVCMTTILYVNRKYAMEGFVKNNGENL